MYGSVPTSWPVCVSIVVSEICAPDRARHAEVEHLRLPVLVDQDVAGLEIAMDDAALMRVLDGVARARQQLDALADATAAGCRRTRSAADR